MSEKIDKYLSTLGRSPRTVKTYGWALSHYTRVVGDDLNDGNYERFLKIIKSLSPSTQRVLRSAVMGLYSFYEIGDPAKRERLNDHYAQREQPAPVSFNREGIEKLITYCDSQRRDLADWRDRAFVLTLADSGLRISELCGLNRNDVDWLNERVPVVGKGNKIAIVRLSKRSLSALMDYFQARDNDGMKSHGKEPMFAQHGNTSFIKKMTADGMRKAVKARMKQAGVKDIRIHDFRHYFVTVTLLASNNMKTAQELARHKSMTTTQRYAHLAENELDKAYDDIFNK